MSPTKKLLGPALGLALSASTMNCLEDAGYGDVYYVQNSIYGTYETEYLVLKDPDNLYEKKKGESELKIYTLGHDANIRFRIFFTRPQDYDRHPIDGWINEEWEVLDAMYPMYPYLYKANVSGNITNEGQLDITVDVDIKNLAEGTTSKVRLDIWGEKISDDLEDIIY